MIYTEKNISEFAGDFYRRSNHIISNFNMCDSITLNHLHATYCTSMYGCELLQHNAKYMSQLYVAWRKSIRRVFRLPSQTHNYIVSNLGGCIIERLDRRLTKYIYNILHSDNNVIKTIVHSKLYMSPKSIIAENYKYISYKYKLSHTDWTESFSYVINKITVPPDPKRIALCNTIRELCEIRDGTKQCEILLNIEFVEALIAQLCVE